MEAHAILRKIPVSPRKVRKVANLVRGLRIGSALRLLKFEKSPNAQKVEQLLLSAVANWQSKHADSKISETELYVKEICVDVAPMIKRYRPAPHGRAHRIRKRSSHLRLRVSATKEAVEITRSDTSNNSSTAEKAVSSSDKK